MYTVIDVMYNIKLQIGQQPNAIMRIHTHMYYNTFKYLKLLYKKDKAFFGRTHSDRKNYWTDFRQLFVFL